MSNTPLHELPAWLKHGTVWLLLAGALFLGVQAWQLRQSSTQVVIQGGRLDLQRGRDGHYHWPGSVAGQAVEFLVDTGASGTAIPAALAHELGLQALGSQRSHTAGGLVTGSVVVADVALRGGVQIKRLRMTVLPDLAVPLLGMDVLGRLRFQQNDGVLRIDLPQDGGWR